MLTDLFDTEQSCHQLELADADIKYYPCFIPHDQADDYFNLLFKELNWQQETINVYGRQYPTPRLSAWYADAEKKYQYSGLVKSGMPWIPLLLEIREKISEVCPAPFNSVLANLYRDQNDGVGWHSDDEVELGKNPVIASLSLGQVRNFHLKHTSNKQLKQTIELAHGSLLVMQGPTQHHWLHQVPKSSRAMSERINLTFRVVS